MILYALVACALFFVLVVIARTRKPGDAFPGPKPLPFIGNAHQCNVLQLSTHLEQWHTEFGPTFQIFLGPTKFVVTSDPDIIRRAFITRPNHFPRPENLKFALRDMLGDTIASAENEDWSRQRHLMAPAFTKYSIGSAFSAVTLCGRRLLARWHKAGEAGAFSLLDLQLELEHYTLDVVTLFAWGYDLNSLQEESQTISDVAAMTRGMKRRMWAMTNLFRITDWREERELRAALDRLTALMQQIISQGRQDGESSKSLLHAMLDSQELTDGELRGNGVGLLLAGLDTTSVTLTWTLWLLAKHPEYQEKIKQEAEAVWPDTDFPGFESNDKLPLAEGAVKEALRMYPPGPFMMFEVDDPEFKIDGREVGVGNNLLTLNKTASRQIFKDPDTFKPERWHDSSDAEVASKYKPETVAFFKTSWFGGGSRICPGRNLAMTEALAVVSAVCRNYKFGLVSDKEPTVVANMVFQPDNVALNVIPRDP